MLGYGVRGRGSSDQEYALLRCSRKAGRVRHVYPSLWEYSRPRFCQVFSRFRVVLFQAAWGVRPTYNQGVHSTSDHAHHDGTYNVTNHKAKADDKGVRLPDCL
jgi:hypothetical protein